MTFQYIIWQKGKRKEHFVFHQKSLRIVYPPSHPFYLKPVSMAIKFYEGAGWKAIDNDAWRGDHIDEYMEAMRQMYPKALPEGTKSKQETSGLLHEKDTSATGVSNDRDAGDELPS